MIYQTFQEETKAREARKIQIMNIGLEPWEALELGLEVETVPDGDKRKAVADYVRARKRKDEEDWEEWLQTHRVELNAMTTPEFIAWLDRKMKGHVGKLVPPHDVLTAELDKQLKNKVHDVVTKRILREAHADEQIAAELAAVARPDAAMLQTGIQRLFKDKPHAEWRAHIEAMAKKLSGTAPGEDGDEDEER